jgi:exopolysaccharide biosynthesis protein
MIKKSAFKFYLIILLVSFSITLTGQIKGFRKVRWESEKPAHGLVWKSTHTILEDTIRQNINILIVDLKSRKISILYNPKENIKTSRQALRAGAIAAVNAGFFNVKEGGSATYIKVEGRIVDPDTTLKWKRNVNMTGAVTIDSKGHLSINPAMSNAFYDAHSGYPYVLVTGPLLIYSRKKVQLPKTSLVVTSHPRSAIGVLSKNKIVLVTLDGRTTEAQGMNLMKLTDLMISLGCRDAVNLDGGGSTTMWINGKPFDGVVNMPCDNKKFDHEGERSVSDIFVIK